MENQKPSGTEARWLIAAMLLRNSFRYLYCLSATMRRAGVSASSGSLTR